MTESIEKVQTKREIQSLLTDAGLAPRKRFGQNFLIDGNLMRRLVESAEIGPDDTVLEIGPGTGGLTDLLVARAGRVVAVEVDKNLASLLRLRFEHAANFELIVGDALAGKHHLHPDLVTAIESASGPIKLTANLPYQAATPLVMNLLTQFPKVHRLVFTVQKEVGERMTASTGRRDYGPLAILCHLLTDAHLVAMLPPSVFWPAPTVESVMLRLDRRDAPGVEARQAAELAALVRGAFDHRRKTLRAALRYLHPPDVVEHLASTVDLSLRPEAIPPEKWVSLHETLREMHPAPFRPPV